MIASLEQLILLDPPRYEGDMAHPTIVPLTNATKNASANARR